MLNAMCKHWGSRRVPPLPVNGMLRIKPAHLILCSTKLSYIPAWQYSFYTCCIADGMEEGNFFYLFESAIVKADAS